MKYYIAGAAVVITAVAALVFSAHPRLSEHDQWRMTTLEKENKVRPARFEDMKFHGGAELREPASAKTKPKPK